MFKTLRFTFRVVESCFVVVFLTYLLFTKYRYRIDIESISSIFCKYRIESNRNSNPDIESSLIHALHNQPWRFYRGQGGHGRRVPKSHRSCSCSCCSCYTFSKSPQGFVNTQRSANETLRTHSCSVPSQIFS